MSKTWDEVTEEIADVETIQTATKEEMRRVALAKKLFKSFNILWVQFSNEKKAPIMELEIQELVAWSYKQTFSRKAE